MNSPDSSEDVRFFVLHDGAGLGDFWMYEGGRWVQHGVGRVGAVGEIELWVSPTAPLSAIEAVVALASAKEK